MHDPYTTGAYALGNPDWHEADAPHKAAAVALLALEEGLRPRSVADVGCGTGAVGVALRRVLAAEGPAPSVEGWEVSPEALRRALPRAAPGVSFRLGDFGRDGAPVDLALCLDVVEHVRDPAGWLRAVGAKAETVALRLPLEDSWWDRARPARARAARERYGHLHAWDRAGALDLVASAGLSVVRETYDRVPVRASGPGQVSDALRRALVAWSPHAGVAVMGGFSWLALLRRP